MKMETFEKASEMVREINRLKEDVSHLEKFNDRADVYLSHIVCDRINCEICFSPIEIEQMIKTKREMLGSLEKELEDF